MRFLNGASQIPPAPPCLIKNERSLKGHKRLKMNQSSQKSSSVFAADGLTDVFQLTRLPAICNI